MRLQRLKGYSDHLMHVGYFESHNSRPVYKRRTDEEEVVPTGKKLETSPLRSMIQNSLMAKQQFSEQSMPSRIHRRSPEGRNVAKIRNMSESMVYMRDFSPAGIELHREPSDTDLMRQHYLGEIENKNHNKSNTSQDFGRGIAH